MPWQAASDERVLDERVAYLITDILSDDTARIPSFGEGSVLDSGPPGGGQDRHHHRLSRQLDGGLYARPGRGRLGRQRRQRADAATCRASAGRRPSGTTLWSGAQRPAACRDFARPDGLVEVEVCALSACCPDPTAPTG